MTGAKKAAKKKAPRKKASTKKPARKTATTRKASTNKAAPKKGASGPLQKFVRSVERDHRTGKATEHTYRPALKALLELLGNRITATNEPKRVECGAPDFVVSRRQSGTDFILGHLEAKALGVSLADVEKDGRRESPRTREGKQLRRYSAALPNLVLTNHLEFRWYVGGERRASACLASITGGGGLKIEDDAATASLLDSFLKHRPAPITTPKELADRMAQLTHLIRDVIVDAFDRGPSTNMEGGEPPSKRSSFLGSRSPSSPTCSRRPSPTACSRLGATIRARRPSSG